MKKLVITFAFVALLALVRLRPNVVRAQGSSSAPAAVTIAPDAVKLEPACTWNSDFRTCRGFQQARPLHGATKVCRWRSRGSPLASRGRECNRGAGHVAGGHGREVRHGQHARVPHRFVLRHYAAARGETIVQ